MHCGFCENEFHMREKRLSILKQIQFGISFTFISLYAIVKCQNSEFFKKKPPDYCYCVHIDLFRAPVGTRCVTLDLKNTWIRVFDGWQHQSGGPIWDPNTIPQTSPLEAVKICKERGETIPRRLFFEMAKAQGFREIFYPILEGSIFFTNDYYRRLRKIGIYEGNSGRFFKTEVGYNCQAICVKCIQSDSSCAD